MPKKLVIIAAICVLLVGAFCGGILIFILKARKAAPTQVQSPSTPVSPSPFANVAESDIPGRYKWISGTQEYFLTLYEDHSFMNKDGTVLREHRWDLTPDALVITWKANQSLFDQIESPGIYTGAKDDGTRRRMEKQPADPSDLLKPNPVARNAALALQTAAAMPAGDLIASIRFGATCETNNLTPVNTGDGDGKIFPGNIGGVECYQLVRKPARPEAYLYLRIAPELKDPPVTRAMVVVEYFDAVPGDARSLLT